MSDPIRAALERLVELEDKRWGTSTWDDAVAAARAALAEQQGEAIGPEWQPCVKLPITVHVRQQRPGETHVSTREGITPVQPDDLIMRGVQGEEYPIGRELFNRTYRLGVAEPTPPAELLADLTSGSKPLDPEIAEVLTPEARWDLYAGSRSQPPAEGEVAELVELLHKEAADDEIGDHMLWMTPADARRAAELLQQQHPTPVPVNERLPEPNTKVLAHYFNALGNGRTICAIWVPAKSRSEDSGDDDFTEYDEENDTYYWPEGWYEAIENWDDLGWVAVNEGEVAYWQPLPKWPALPLPQGEVES